MERICLQLHDADLVTPPLESSCRATSMTDIGLSDQFDRALFKKLNDLLGPPVLPAAAPKKQPVRRKMVRPKEISERTWN
jgi:hypothetical protein